MSRSILHQTTAYPPTAEVVEMTGRVEAFLQEKAVIAGACEVQRERLAAAKEKRAELVAERDDFDLALVKAKAAGSADLAELHDAVDDRTVMITTLDEEIARISALEGRLAAECEAINKRLEQFKADFAAAGVTQQAEHRATFEMRIKAALEPLIAVLAEGYALGAAARRSVVANFLDEVHVPAPGGGGGTQPILKNGYVQTLDRGRVSLRDAWQDEPGAAAILEGLAAFTETSRRLAAERPLDAPKVLVASPAPAGAVKPPVRRTEIIHRSPGTPANESVTTVIKGSSPENTRSEAPPRPLEIHRTPGTPAPRDGRGYGVVRQPGTPAPAQSASEEG